MEKLEQKVGFPSHDLHGNPEGASNAGGSYPGPASYEKGMVESQPQYSPIPGPGYSSGGALLQISSSQSSQSQSQSHAKNPTPPSLTPNDYQTLISNKDNLKQRMSRNYNLEPAEHQHAMNEQQQEQNTRASIQSIHQNNQIEQPLKNVRFLDTRSLKKNVVGGGVPAMTNDGGKRGASMMSIQESNLLRSKTEDGVQLTNALAAAYDAAHDPFLGLRPEDQPAQQKSDGSSDSGVSLLELKTKLKSKQTKKGFMDSMAGMAAGAAGAMGAGIKCPEGMPFCRKALRRIGRRSMARRERRAAKNKEMSDTMNAMQDALEELQVETKKFGAVDYFTFSSQIKKIASEYLHDYSDEEICSDINMCSVGQNAGQLPISKSAFSLIRL